MKQINFLAYALAMLMCMSFNSYGQFQDLEYLRIDHVSFGNTYFSLGNNPESYLRPAVDVTAGGNTHLSLTFRISDSYYKGSFFMYLRLNDSRDLIALRDYLPEGFAQSYEWTTIQIPFSEISPSIDLTNLFHLELDYATWHTFDLKSLEFTGGSTPYLWYGYGKRNVSHNGYGFNSDFVAAVQSDLYMTAELDYSKAKAPYNGKATLIANYKDQFDQEAFAGLWKWSDGYTGRLRDNMAPGSYEVVFGPIDGAYDTLNFTLHSQGPLSPEVSFNSPTANSDGHMAITLSGGLPSYYHDDLLIKFDTATNEILNQALLGYTNGYNFPLEVRQDHEGNYYELTTFRNTHRKYLIKRNPDYEVIWAQEANYVYSDFETFTDDQGRTVLFTRLRNSRYAPDLVVINERQYNILNEAYAFIMYNPDGSIEWVKVMDTILFSITTADVVEDSQGRMIWLMKQDNRLGTKTIMVVMAKNGNVIERYDSEDWGNIYTLGGFSLMTDGNNQTYVYSYQDAGTKFITQEPLPVRSQYLHKFDEDMNLVLVKSLGDDLYERPRDLEDSRERVFTLNREYIVGTDESGVPVWQIPYGDSIKRLGAGDSYIYLQNISQNRLNIYNYEGNSVGETALPISLNTNFIMEDIHNNVHLYVRNDEAGYGTSYHTRLDLIVRDGVSIPAGSNSFSYEVRDTLQNKYLFEANFVASRVAEEVLEGEELNASGQMLSLHPNPAVSDVQFTYPGALPSNQLTMTDLSGRVIDVWQNVPGDGLIISRNGLQEGIYLITYEDADIKQTKRIIFK